MSCSCLEAVLKEEKERGGREDGEELVRIKRRRKKREYDGEE